MAPMVNAGEENFGAKDSGSMQMLESELFSCPELMSIIKFPFTLIFFNFNLHLIMKI